MEATKRIRRSATALSRHTPIVGVTAHALPEEQERLRAAGMQDCLIKPVRARNLQEFLRRLTDFPDDFSGEAHAAKSATAAKEQVAAVMGPPEIDDATLQELVSLLPAHVFQDRLARFSAEVEDMAAGLEQARASGDIAGVGKLAHRHGGSAAIFGAVGLREHLVKVETAANKGEAESVLALLTPMAALCKRTNQSLRAYDKV